MLSKAKKICIAYKSDWVYNGFLKCFPAAVVHGFNASTSEAEVRWSMEPEASPVSKLQDGQDSVETWSQTNKQTNSNLADINLKPIQQIFFDHIQDKLTENLAWALAQKGPCITTDSQNTTSKNHTGAQFEPESGWAA